MNEKGSKIGLILAFVLIAAVGFSIYWLFLKPDANESKTADLSGGVGIVDDSKTTDSNTDTTNPDSTDTGTDPKPDTSTGTDNIPIDQAPDATTTDFTTFLSTQQTVGDVKNKAEYTLKSVTDTKKDGFHRFDFSIQSKTSETMESPYVVVKYNSTLGAIRATLNGVTKDESGIGYQKSRNIDEQGVIRLYHNVSSNASEELYDIGVAKSTVFKVTSVEGSVNTWKITVDVKYPGGNTTSEAFGSSTFSKDAQALDGALAADSAKVVSYSYSTSGGVWSIVFNVSGSSSRPVPSAEIKYNADGNIELAFTQLVSDNAYKSLDGKKLGNFTFDTSKVGDRYVYVIKGATKEYRLMGSKSPNQVILEVKL